ncbi:MAG: APC family permease [Planctomycetota bacterium]|nr:APC family permease [Planctomycetota bacterium]
MTNRHALQKGIGRLGFFSLAFGSMIGVGWITGLQGMFEQAGPLGTAIAFIFGGLLMVVIGLCYAEAISILPVTGGEVAYAYKAFGTQKAFFIGWALAFGYLSVSAFEAVSIGIVLSYLVKMDYWALYDVYETTVYGSHVLLALVFTVFVALINYCGAAIATRFQIALTMLLVLCTVGFVSAGFWDGEIQNVSPAFGSQDWKIALSGMLAVFVTVPFWYVGFDTIPQAAEERVVDLPTKRLGQILIVAILGSTLFYVLVFTSVGLITPWQDIIKKPLPTAVAFETAFKSPVLGRVVLLVGLIGLVTSWNGFFLAGTRVLFALGRGHIIHSTFGKTHQRFGTPSAAILVCGMVTFFGSLLGKPAILILLNVGSFCIALAFLGVALSLLKLRKFNGSTGSVAYRLMPYLAAAGSLFILGVMVFQLRKLEWYVLIAVILSGVVFWVAARKSREQLSQQQRHQLILDEDIQNSDE